MLRVSKIITIGLALAAVACTVKTDPELENRLARLEQRCDQLNQELSSLSDLVNATGSGDWVTDVTPVTEDGVITGYLVNFYVHGPILITCGKDGADGKSPALGVTTLEDGNLYWTLNGAVLKDAAGKPVSAHGVTPQMKVEEGNWYVSYDGGKTWTYAGSATAVPEGQVVFKDVTVDTQAGNVTFTLSDGSTFAASLKPSVEMMLDTEGLEAPIVGGETITIGYTLTGADENTLVTAASDGNYKVTVKKEGMKGGKILVTAPQDYTDGFVNVILSNGRGYTYVKVINFYERKGSVSGGGRDYEYAVPTVGGTLEVPISVNFPYTVKTNASWFELVDTRASVHTDRLKFNFQKNENTSIRTGKVYIYPDNHPSEAFLTITFNQASAYFYIDKTQFIIDAEGGAFTTGLHTSKDFSVVIPDDASWLTRRVSSSGNGDYTLTLTATKNSGSARRQAEVKVVGANNTTLATLFVAQFASDEDERAAMIITVRANYANDFTVGVPVYVYYPDELENVLIDWGDGIVEHWTSVKSSPVHTYSGLEIAQSFDVKITGRVESLSTVALSSLQKESIIAVKQWGRLGVKFLYSIGPDIAVLRGAFADCTNLVSIATDNDYSFADLKSARSAFSGCTSLTKLPEGLFANCTEATIFDYCFDQCTGLRSLPARLFSSSAVSFDSCFSGCSGLVSMSGDVFTDCSSATSFYKCFYKCTSLKSLPENLFVNCTSAIDFKSCFSDCTSLQTLPKWLFGNNPAARDFSSCFSGCVGIESLPNHVFANCPAVTSFESCFAGCSGLQRLPEYLFDLFGGHDDSAISFNSCFKGCTGLKEVQFNLFRSCTTAGSFEGCFSGCTGLQDIPYNLFWACSSVESFADCFSGCTGLQRIPEDLFKAGIAVLSFEDCFRGCTRLQSLPGGLFRKCQLVQSFERTFSGCTSLKDVPSSIFSDNRKVDSFYSTFYGCRSLEGESPYSLIDKVKVHLYERANYPDYFHAPKDYGYCFSSCKNLTDYASIPSAWK